MVDFKKYLNDSNLPWWADVKHPEQTERRRNHGLPEFPELDDDDIEALSKIIEARIQEITLIAKEHSEMPRGTAAKTRNGLDFLKVDHLTTDKQIFVILWAGTHEDAGMQNKYNAELLLKVQKENGGAKWLLSLNPDAPVLKSLDAGFGHDETQWKDRKIYLFNEIHPVTDAKYMRCETIEMGGSPAKSPAKPA